MGGEPLVILLVEDNPDHAELILRCLEDYRVANKIHHVPDGETALDYLFRQGNYTNPENSPHPHVILLDLHLPKIDGLEVLKVIKTDEDLRCVPTVVLTTSEAEKDMARAYNYNANSYLVKPVEFDKFSQLMDNLGSYWLTWNRRQ